jgi:PIN domain nuclease of toxin-antitoxin system
VTVVLDASAILAWLSGERGAEVVERSIAEGLVSVVNWSEVLQKVGQWGRDAFETAAILEAVGVTVSDATKGDAERAVLLWTSDYPLSLGDRFCLALAERMAAPVLTADRRWADIKAAVKVRLIR